MAFVVGPAQASEISCRDVGSCTKGYFQSGDSRPGIGREENAYIDKLTEFGSEALPTALANLESPEKYYQASYLVRQLRDHLRAEHLPILKRTFRGDGDWIPLAIAAIGTSEAFQFLAQQASLHALDSGGDQYGFAFQKAGEQAIPYLLDTVDCDHPLPDQRTTWLAHILDEMEHEAAPAKPTLKKLSLRKECPDQVRLTALFALDAMAGNGIPLSASSYTQLLQDENEDIRFLAGEIITRSGGSSAEQVYRQNIMEMPADDPYYLRDIGLAGHTAISAGPYILERYPEFGFDAKPQAARTLGQIGYRPAIPQLIKSLNSSSDWELSKASAEALGRLRAQEALPLLAYIAESHWHPETRDAARRAETAITSDPEGLRDIYGPAQQPGLSNMEVRDGPEPCATVSDYPNLTPEKNRFYASEEPERAANFQIPVPIPEGRRQEDPTLPQFFYEDPVVGIKIGNNWLLGSNRGEWGGHIAARMGNDPIEVLEYANVEDIYRFPNGRIVAVTGIAHLFINRGYLQTIEQAGQNSWQVTKWRKLPGAPRSSWLVAPDQLLVNTLNGSIIISQDGRIRLADCHAEG